MRRKCALPRHGGITLPAQTHSIVRSLGVHWAGLMVVSALWNNSDAYNRVWFRPRVMIDVTEVDTSTKILGVQSSIPIYVSPTARNGLGQSLASPFILKELAELTLDRARWR